MLRFVRFQARRERWTESSRKFLAICHIMLRKCTVSGIGAHQRLLVTTASVYFWEIYRVRFMLCILTLLLLLLILKMTNIFSIIGFHLVICLLHLEIMKHTLPLFKFLQRQLYKALNNSQWAHVYIYIYIYKYYEICISNILCLNFSFGRVHL